MANRGRRKISDGETYLPPGEAVFVQRLLDSGFTDGDYDKLFPCPGGKLYAERSLHALKARLKRKGITIKRVLLYVLDEDDKRKAVELYMREIGNV